MPIKALDISKHQGSIDVNKTKSQGINNIILRASYAEFKDIKFDEFNANCKSAGINMGSYIFFTYHYKDKNNEDFNTAVELMKIQVNALLNIIKGKNITGWIGLDQELEKGHSLGLPKDQNTTILNMAADIIRSNGYSPCLYCSASWLKSNIDVNKLNMPIWAAYYYRYAYGPDFNEVPELPNTEWGNYLKSLGNKLCAWQFGSVNHGSKYGVGSVGIDRNWIYYNPEENKEDNMGFNSIDGKQLVVTKVKGHSRQAFSIPNVNDSNVINLAPGIYEVEAIGDYEQITPELGGTWYRIANGDKPYVLVLDARLDEMYVDDVPNGFVDVHDKTLVVTAKKGHSRQAFASPNTNDPVFTNLAAGEYEIIQKGPHEFITPEFPGDWYRIANVNTPYVIVLDARLDEMYVRDDANTEPEVKPEPEVPVEPEVKPDPEPEVKPDPDVKPEPEVPVEPEVKPERYAEVQIHVEDKGITVDICLNGKDLTENMIKAADMLKKYGF